MVPWFYPDVNADPLIRDMWLDHEEIWVVLPDVCVHLTSLYLSIFGAQHMCIYTGCQNNVARPPARG